MMIYSPLYFVSSIIFNRYRQHIFIMLVAWYYNLCNIQERQYPDKYHGIAFRACFILFYSVKHWQFSCGIPGVLLKDLTNVPTTDWDLNENLYLRLWVYILLSVYIILYNLTLCFVLSEHEIHSPVGLFGLGTRREIERVGEVSDGCKVKF